MGGQVTLLCRSSRHWRCSASGSRAGNHCAACESPTSATVLVPAGSPYTQSRTAAAVHPRTQPCWNGSWLSSGAASRDGVRFDGTAATPAEAATSACACAVRSRTGSGALGVAVAEACPGTERVVLLAAAPVPTGDGTTAPTTTATATPAAVRPPPRARLRRGERRSGAAKRTGSSTSSTVATASTSDTATAPSRPGSPAPTTAGASSSTGQCHRYQA